MLYPVTCKVTKGPLEPLRIVLSNIDLTTYCKKTRFYRRLHKGLGATGPSLTPNYTHSYTNADLISEMREDAYVETYSRKGYNDHASRQYKSEAEARGAPTAFLHLLVPFVRKGLIEGVYGSSAGEVPPSEALQKMIEKMGVGVSEVEPKEAVLSPLPHT